MFVFFEVGIECLDVISMSFGFKGLIMLRYVAFWRNHLVTPRHTCWVAGAVFEGNDLASPSLCLPLAADLL